MFGSAGIGRRSEVRAQREAVLAGHLEPHERVHGGELLDARAREPDLARQAREPAEHRQRGVARLARDALERAAVLDHGEERRMGARSPGLMRPPAMLRKNVPPPGPSTSTRIVASTAHIAS